MTSDLEQMGRAAHVLLDALVASEVDAENEAWDGPATHLALERMSQVGAAELTRVDGELKIDIGVICAAAIDLGRWLTLQLEAASGQGFDDVVLGYRSNLVERGLRA